MSGGEKCQEERQKGLQNGRNVLLSETWIPLGQSNVGAWKSCWVREEGRE